MWCAKMMWVSSNSGMGMLGVFREGGAGRKLARNLVASLAGNRWGLRALNVFYDKSNDRGKRRFYLLFAKIFNERGGAIYRDSWRVAVLGGQLKTPLGAGDSWLDWDLALALLGHDQEVKQTYSAIFASEMKPAQFIDVGANYGSHSLLAAKAGVPTLSFEPNPHCVAYFKQWAEANGISPSIERVALGDSNSEVRFDFPMKATWLGMISDKDDLPEGYRRITVPLRRLDEYLDEFAPGSLLIKLDAEGAEPAIIRGADRLIAGRRPQIIFECWKDSEARLEIACAFAGRFRFYGLPWSPASDAIPMETSEFITSSETNFIAVPI